MEKPLGCYFEVWYPYYQVVQCNQKTPIPVSSRWQVWSEKVKKGKALTLITANTCIHLPKMVSTDLTIKSDSVLANPLEKMGCEAGWCNKICTPSGIFIVTPSLEGWSTNAKKAPSPHEVRLTLLEHQPSITMYWGHLNVKGGYLFSSQSFCYFLVEWDGLHDHQR